MERNATAGARTLTARSVLLSVLLGTDPPRLPVGLLVRTTELFGIAEGTTRTALSRMVATGELTTTDGWYEIASPASCSARAARPRAAWARRSHGPASGCKPRWSPTGGARRRNGPR